MEQWSTQWLKLTPVLSYQASLSPNQQIFSTQPQNFSDFFSLVIWTGSYFIIVIWSNKKKIFALQSNFQPSCPKFLGVALKSTIDLCRLSLWMFPWPRFIYLDILRCVLYFILKNPKERFKNYFLRCFNSLDVTWKISFLKTIFYKTRKYM